MIYFIRDTSSDFVKIGYSYEPENRLKQLQTGSVARLEIIVVIPGDMTEEKALHKKFIDYRVRGEWYRYEGALAVYIDNLLSIDFGVIENFSFGKTTTISTSITEPLSNYVRIDSKVSLQKNNDEDPPVIALVLIVILSMLMIGAMFTLAKK